MKSFTRRRAQRALGVAGLAAATLLAFGSFAQAEPEAAAVIKACVNKKTGVVRIPDLPHATGGNGCAKNERAVLWNVRGPRGPQGPEGPEGPQGPPGTGGLPAAFEVAVEDEELTLDDTVIASLPLAAGRYLLNASITASQNDVTPTFTCSLNVGTTFIDEVTEQNPVEDEGNSFLTAGGMTGLATVGLDGGVDLVCRGVGSVDTATVTAVQVAPATTP